ncbi:MAG: hypothetical protein CUN56_03075 [Phototrophicales bacterium]|nr:MAG: hypothetical protein CUN56_03075 [Phototrophicales bacterium]RMG72584.1 MAG: hypothetical protein D6711_12615 [Chloroflexota bacterium]
MSEIKNENNWKNKTYAYGAIGGLLFGLLSAYLYARAAEENAYNNGGTPSPITTGQLLSLLLAALGLIRQIAESGKPKK